MTIIVARNHKSGSSRTTQIETGQFMLGIGGTFDGATVAVYMNLGPAIDVPIADAVYTEPSSEILWLPTCTVYVKITDAGDDTDVNVCFAAVSSQVT